VHIRAGDGKKGLPEGAPFDRIVVSCSATTIPASWREQLRPGGLLLFPYGKDADRQFLWRWRRGKKNWDTREGIFAVRFVPLL